MTFDDLKKAISSEWLKLVFILVALVGSWYKFDYRIQAVELHQQEEAGQVQHLSDVIDKLDNTLDRMNQTMRDFPPHRHVNDESVIYPGDTVLDRKR
jgi:hypothetical protein